MPQAPLRRGFTRRRLGCRGLARVVLPAAALPLEPVPAEVCAVVRRVSEASTLAWSAAISSTTCPDCAGFAPLSSVATRWSSFAFAQLLGVGVVVRPRLPWCRNSFDELCGH